MLLIWDVVLVWWFDGHLLVGVSFFDGIWAFCARGFLVLPFFFFARGSHSQFFFFSCGDWASQNLSCFGGYLTLVQFSEW